MYSQETGGWREGKGRGRGRGRGGGEGGEEGKGRGGIARLELNYCLPGSVQPGDGWVEGEGEGDGEGEEGKGMGGS